MRIHHLNCGTFCPVGKLMVNGHGSPAQLGRLVCHCLLLETNEGLVLVDTGLGLGDIAYPGRRLPGRLWQILNQAQLLPEETAVHQVRAIGFNANDVRHIVLTHLDFDHAGGLGDFPQANVHVLGLEHDAAIRRRGPMERVRYAPSQFAHRPHWVLHKVRGEQWMGFDSVQAISESQIGTDVLLVPLVGHSRGHCGVAINTGNGWLLHCGDAVFYHGEIEHAHRHCPLGLRIYQNIFQHNRRQRMQNQKRLRELVRTNGESVRVICSHDPDMFDPLARIQGQSAKALLEI
jgi:glyoxylase-like metal-dependent hydrolase (beta-lactamase superfamily II)